MVCWLRAFTSCVAVELKLIELCHPISNKANEYFDVLDEVNLINRCRFFLYADRMAAFMLSPSGGYFIALYSKGVKSGRLPLKKTWKIAEQNF